ncbi:zinc ribbon domain-containing protein [Fictibacillus nanhaiensis]|uniref:zinc ribbon domain-containing protein n=1 Tax=Fictibacillus nanhaiensis TaxID=742169 RepID=UPI002E1B6B37|nr:zinc ribbon domain-containing protein [Fictibacillus nanhaiensis]
MRFKGLIRCSECLKNYKVKMYRDKVKYACGGRCNYGKDFCSNNPISEKELDFYVDMRYEKQLSAEELNEEIDEIVMYLDKFEIRYKDGHVQSYNQSVINF